jgi:uncharacterized protein YaiE (UPF0345 family)
MKQTGGFQFCKIIILLFTTAIPFPYDYRKKEDRVFKVNDYFEGNVKSIAFSTTEGPATVGVMPKGEYEFGTSTKEIMIVTTGRLMVKLPGASGWRGYKPFETFEVEANKKFQVRIDEESSYVCFYR